MAADTTRQENTVTAEINEISGGGREEHKEYWEATESEFGPVRRQIKLANLK